MIADLVDDTFAANDWGRRARLRTDVASELPPLTADGLLALLPGLGLSVKAAARGDDGQHRERALPPEEARDAFSRGQTLCALGLHEVDPAVARELAALKLALGAIGRSLASAYLSPDGGGFGLHFDEHHVFLVQLQGQKEWRFSAAPAVTAPPANLIASRLASARARQPWAPASLPDESSLERVVLQPGDILYLPPGAWHRGEARGTSLGLTLSFRVPSMADFVSDWLGEELAHRSELREEVPLARGGEPGALPDAIATWFRRQRASVGDGLSRLDGAAFQRWWIRELARLPADPFDGLEEGSAGWSRLALRADRGVRYSVDPSDPTRGLVIRAGSRLSRMPLLLVPLLDRLAAEGVLDRSSLLGPLAPEDLDAAGRLLVASGCALRVAP